LRMQLYVCGPDHCHGSYSILRLCTCVLTSIMFAQVKFSTEFNLSCANRLEEGDDEIANSGIDRRISRQESGILRQLLDIVGTSKRLYNSVLQLCRVHFQESGDVSACALRSQLLMALHDSAASVELCSHDRCHKLAWCLDACVRDGVCEPRRVKEMKTFFDSMPLRGGGGGSDTDSDNDGGGSSTDNNLSVLGDAGMILRDPCVLSFIVSEIVNTLEQVVECEKLPKSSQTLQFLMKLVSLAMGTRRMIKDGAYKMPHLSTEVLEEFFPVLAHFLIEAQLHDEDDEIPAEEYALDPQLLSQLARMIKKDAGVRKVALGFCLIRCQVADYVSTAKMLRAIGVAMESSSLKDEVAFCRTCCHFLTERLETTTLSLESPVVTLFLELLLCEKKKHQHAEDVPEDAAVCVCHHSVVVHEAMLAMIANNAAKFEKDFMLQAVERSMKGALGRHRKGKRKRDVETDGAFGKESELDVERGVRELSMRLIAEHGELFTEESAPHIHRYLSRFG